MGLDLMLGILESLINLLVCVVLYGTLAIAGLFFISAYFWTKASSGPSPINSIFDLIRRGPW